MQHAPAPPPRYCESQWTARSGTPRYGVPDAPLVVFSLSSALGSGDQGPLFSRCVYVARRLPTGPAQPKPPNPPNPPVPSIRQATPPCAPATPAASPPPPP